MKISVLVSVIIVRATCVSEIVVNEYLMHVSYLFNGIVATESFEIIFLCLRILSGSLLIVLSIHELLGDVISELEDDVSIHIASKFTALDLLKLSVCLGVGFWLIAGG